MFVSEDDNQPTVKVRVMPCLFLNDDKQPIVKVRVMSYLFLNDNKQQTVKVRVMLWHLYDLDNSCFDVNFKEKDIKN